MRGGCAENNDDKPAKYMETDSTLSDNAVGASDEDDIADEGDDKPTIRVPYS